MLGMPCERGFAFDRKPERLAVVALGMQAEAAFRLFGKIWESDGRIFVQYRAVDLWFRHGLRSNSPLVLYILLVTEDLDSKLVKGAAELLPES